MVYILLGSGFEELEALAPCDILRRGGVEVRLAGIGGTRITGGHGIGVSADCRVEDIKYEDMEMLIIPGGLGGVEAIEGSSAASEIIHGAHERGIELAAICAGPRVLAKLGLLNGKKAVCYPGMEDEMTGGDMQPGSVTVRDEKLTTACGAGAAVDFALALLEVLRGSEAAEEIAKSICLRR